TAAAKTRSNTPPAKPSPDPTRAPPAKPSPPNHCLGLPALTGEGNPT
ncbi:hypothetical protein A2U01_0117460, partial [Trifolium medium]|nr:hypothetical protein [Trifolium medium]